MLICGQFVAKDLNLLSTLLFVHFEKWNFSDFWHPQNVLGPSKKNSTFGFLTFENALKTRSWADRFKNIVLYLLLIRKEANLWSVFPPHGFDRKFAWVKRMDFGSSFTYQKTSKDTLLSGWYWLWALRNSWGRAQPDWEYEFPDWTRLDTQICWTYPARPD